MTLYRAIFPPVLPPPPLALLPLLVRVEKTGGGPGMYSVTCPSAEMGSSDFFFASGCVASLSSAWRGSILWEFSCLLSFGDNLVCSSTYLPCCEVGSMSTSFTPPSSSAAWQLCPRVLWTLWLPGTVLALDCLPCLDAEDADDAHRGCLSDLQHYALFARDAILCFALILCMYPVVQQDTR